MKKKELYKGNRHATHSSGISNRASTNTFIYKVKKTRIK